METDRPGETVRGFRGSTAGLGLALLFNNKLIGTGKTNEVGLIVYVLLTTLLFFIFLQNKYIKRKLAVHKAINHNTGDKWYPLICNFHLGRDDLFKTALLLLEAHWVIAVGIIFVVDDVNIIVFQVLSCSSLDNFRDTRESKLRQS